MYTTMADLPFDNEFDLRVVEITRTGIVIETNKGTFRIRRPKDIQDPKIGDVYRAIKTKMTIRGRRMVALKATYVRNDPDINWDAIEIIKPKEDVNDNAKAINENKKRRVKDINIEGDFPFCVVYIWKNIVKIKTMDRIIKINKPKDLALATYGDVYMGRIVEYSTSKGPGLRLRAIRQNTVTKPISIPIQDGEEIKIRKRNNVVTEIIYATKKYIVPSIFVQIVGKIETNKKYPVKLKEKRNQIFMEIIGEVEISEDYKELLKLRDAIFT